MTHLLNLFWIILLAYQFTHSYVSSACNEASAQLFPPYNESTCDQSYSPITEEGASPLCFQRATVVYGDVSQNPCLKVTGTLNRAVEVMFETVPEAKLCVKDQTQNTGRCDAGRSNRCDRAKANVMVYEFYCDKGSGCSESDVTFWVRLTRGPPAEQDNEGMWCQGRDGRYPGDLATLPPGVSPPGFTTPVVSSAQHIGSGHLALYGALLIAFFLKITVT